MKFSATVLLVTIGVASAARLEHTYLPPGSAATAGGANFIQAPGFAGGNYNHGGSASGSGSSSAYQGAGAASSFQSQGGYQAQSGAYQGQKSFQGQSGAYQGQKSFQGPQYAITQYNNENNGDGSYRFNYETENGISAQESGVLQGDAEAVSGSYSYTGPDGVQYTIHYTAGPEGFHAEGAHIPTPPPIPEEIRRGVELSLAAEARGENQDGQYRAEPQQAYNNYQKSGAAYSGANSFAGVGSAANKGGYRY